MAAAEGYQRLRGVLRLEHLLTDGPGGRVQVTDDATLRADLARLRKQGPLWAAAVEHWLALCAAGAPPPRVGPPAASPAATQRAAALEDAARRLPLSVPLIVYAATAAARAGDLAHAEQLARVARSERPDHPLVLALAVELARSAGRADDAAQAAAALQSHTPPGHLARRIVAAPLP